MKQAINLSSGRKRVDKALKKIYFASIAFFITTVVISLSLIAYRLVLKNSYEVLDQKEKELNSKLLTMQEKKDKYLETRSRLKEIKNILTKRSPTTNRISYVTSILPQDSKVDTISGSEDEVEISLESENLVALNELMEQKIQNLAKDRKQKITKIEMNSFGLNPKTLLYSVSFTVTFG